MTRVEAQLRLVRATLALLDQDEPAYEQALDGFTTVRLDVQFGELITAMIALMGALLIDASGRADTAFRLRQVEVELENAAAAVAARAGVTPGV